MRIYIAYKYTNTPDKEALKRDLSLISSHLESKGHSTFVLGRDHQKWDKCSISHISNTAAILSNLKKSDLILFYVNSSVHSAGIFVEMFLSKILFKKNIYFVNKNVKCNLCALMANKCISFYDINDLLNTLDTLQI